MAAILLVAGAGATLVRSPSSSQGPLSLAVPHPSAPSTAGGRLEANGITRTADPTFAAVASISVGTAPDGVAYDPTTNELFVANQGTDNVSVISGIDNQVLTSIPVGSSPTSVAYDPSTGEVFVTNYLSGNLSVISVVTNTVVDTIRITTGPSSLNDVVYAAGTHDLYVADGGITDRVNVISDVTDRILTNITVGSTPNNLAYDPATDEIFVTNGNSNDVSVISDATETVVATIPVGSYPTGIVYDPAQNELFVANTGPDQSVYSPSHNLSVISDLTNTVVASVPASGSPQGGLAYDATSGEIWTANWTSNTTSAISAASGSLFATVPVGSLPANVAYDSDNGFVYVANQGSDNLSVINTTPLYGVSFDESGLPAGSQWWVNLTAGGSFTGVGPAISFNVSNGTYPYVLGSANTSWAAPGGSFGVNGLAVEVPVTFALQTYAVTFTETGLSTQQLAKDGWTVTLGGETTFSHATAVAFSGFANGSYLVLVLGPNGEVNSEAYLYDQVVHGTTAVSVVFSKGKTATLTFAEKGLTKGTSWCVSLQSDQQCSTASTIKYAGIDTQHPSNYYAVVSPTIGQTITVAEGKTQYDTSGLIDISKNTKLVVTYSYPYAVTFTQSGLTSGSWSITIKGSTQTALWDQGIEFNLTNASYAYRIGAEPGYKSSGVPPKVAVNGATVSVAVTFSKKA